MDQGAFPMWKGLFDWSMKYQDGTKPPGSLRPEDFTPERRAWLSEALQSYMMDFAVRMKEIKEVLEESSELSNDSADEAESKLEKQEQLLEELMDIVSSLDHARDLHKIGGLPPLLSLLSCAHPSLRWRSAEVVATCCANNPPVQLWFGEGGVLPPLLKLALDEDATCRSKALLALSAFVRHSAPSMKAFRAAGGLATVTHMCMDVDSRVQRKAMTLLQYIISRDRSSASTEATSLGVIPMAVAVLNNVTLPGEASVSEELQDGVVDNDGNGDGVGSDQRQAALLLLVELSKHAQTWKEVKEVSGIQKVLQRIIRRHSTLSVEDQEAEQEEKDLADLLLQALEGNEPPQLTDTAAENDDVTDESTMASRSDSDPRSKAAANGSLTSGYKYVAHESCTLSSNTGALVACPKVDKI
ncbi:hypothetical protein CEUSTIGMA_g12737.t1 [Chlamydomonas eustigma]|uniref:Nucleotide exchange factor Fes1 domain-containing protein n=1 Tax=Chlamydomonas eustigma TaxID=1157962 RepID=A0A250XR85_9CHLO|nr:hypothetical protein CEUSTIGMA_g12737.t1 [Chlamydomonas eustigma]|eukprot:GAX85320.1 hypothetical protein CEUSTIGMA_g12737.t1 [Chlamydomonas eustigma]